MSQPTYEWEERECNKRLINEVAEEQEVYISQVESVLQHYSSFIARTIRSGSLEGVSVPYLGKFQVKFKNHQFRSYLHSLHPVFKKMLQQAPPGEMEKLFEL